MRRNTNLIDEVLKQIPNKYMATIIASKHARAINDGLAASIKTGATKPTTMAFMDTRSVSDPRVYLRTTLDWITIRTSDQVIAVSDEIKEIIHKTYGVKESKILVVKNGIIFDESIAEFVDLGDRFRGPQAFGQE